MSSLTTAYSPTSIQSLAINTSIPFKLIPHFLKRDSLKLLLIEKVSHLSASKKLERYKACSDAELISYINDGDHDAFEFVYRSYVRLLYSFAKKNINSKEDCQEIVHDIFLDLWSRRTQILQTTQLRPYLFSAVRYKVIRYIQHSKVKQRYCDHYKAFEATYQLADDQDNEVDLKALIIQGILDLPKRCQQVIQLRLENLSNAEIADRMRISKGTVENYIVTAREHLRKKNIKYL